MLGFLDVSSDLQVKAAQTSFLYRTKNEELDYFDSILLLLLLLCKTKKSAEMV